MKRDGDKSCIFILFSSFIFLYLLVDTSGEHQPNHGISE